MVMTDDDDVARRVRMMRLHGIDRDVLDRYTQPSARPGATTSSPPATSTTSPTPLPPWDACSSTAPSRCATPLVTSRARYDAAFADLPLAAPRASWPRTEPARVAPLLLRLRDDARLDRDAFIERMQSRASACSVHFIPLHLLSYWRDRTRPARRGLPGGHALLRPSGEPAHLLGDSPTTRSIASSPRCGPPWDVRTVLKRSLDVVGAGSRVGRAVPAPAGDRAASSGSATGPRALPPGTRRTATGATFAILKFRTMRAGPSRRPRSPSPATAASPTSGACCDGPSSTSCPSSSTCSRAT